MQHNDTLLNPYIPSVQNEHILLGIIGKRKARSFQPSLLNLIASKNKTNEIIS